MAANGYQKHIDSKTWVRTLEATRPKMATSSSISTSRLMSAMQTEVKSRPGTGSRLGTASGKRAHSTSRGAVR